MWAPVLPAFAQWGFRAIAIDMPGYGESYRPRVPPGLADYAQAALQTLSALQIDVADVVSHHTGAAVALQMAADAPHAIRRLVAWGVPLLEPELQERLANEAPPEYDETGDMMRAYWARRRQFSGAAYSTEVGVRCAIEMLQTGPTRPWGHWAVARADIVALLRQVQQPVLVLAGQNDPVWARSAEAAGLLANGSFRCIEGAGLDVVDQHPRELVELAAAFLVDQAVPLP